MEKRKSYWRGPEVAIAALLALASVQLSVLADQAIKRPLSQPAASQVPTKGVKHKMAIAIFGAG